ncbi:MAG: hypothetical protein M1830_005270 [Pleopsidium flavum]|nr:MAG: hypothetical protein M1830_005270 [Pleopsidium flavum]
MSISPFFRRILILLVPFSVVSTIYLYLYPLFHGCAFPSPNTSSARAFLNTIEQHTSNHLRPDIPIAPFRLLALGDPQLEGDSSLPDAGDGYFPSLESLRTDIIAAQSWGARATALRYGLWELFGDDLPTALKSWRKRLDLFGNDYYLAHIYRTMYWWSRPTHVTVLGDLLGSQWVTDDEFARRGRRYWHRVFNKGTRVENEITELARPEVLEVDEKWQRRIINIAGNHDVGYAGDMTTERVERFEKVFGKANWEVIFQDVSSSKSIRNSSNIDLDVPELRVVVLNSLNLDTPALEEDLQQRTYNFMNDVIMSSRPVEDRKVATVLLTHLPLHKEDGICVDGPSFAFHSDDYGGGVKEQNHISYNAGKGILEGIFGMSSNPTVPGSGLGRNGVILTGHDHEGCDVYHHIPSTMDEGGGKWNATRWREATPLVQEPIPGIREITVRSMMGNFGGNAGLLCAWFDHRLGQWQFKYSTCSVGVQHIWWAVHVLDFLMVCGLLLAGLIRVSKLYVATVEQEAATPTEVEILDEDRKSVTLCTSQGTRAGCNSGTAMLNSDVHEQGDVQRKKRRKV